MLRVLLDDHGSGSKDLFVKIDGRPTYVWVVDTSWLDFFFNTDDGPLLSDNELALSKKTDVALLIQFWQKILFSDQAIDYLPYYLHDQGGQALQITKRKKLYHITPVGTADLTEGTTKSQFTQIQKDIAWRQQINPDLEWELAPVSIQTGLNWSLAQLKQPVVPLHYK